MLRWLETPGTRLVELEGTWCSPRHGAGRLRDWLDAGRGIHRTAMTAGTCALCIGPHADPGSADCPHALDTLPV